MVIPSLNILSLCAGVGGLDLGIHIAEPRSRGVCYVEREAYAAATLAARMEAGELAAAPIWDDLTTFDACSWRGAVHCVASGDPCQPNSVAGKRLGTDDERWLAEHVVRIFDESGAPRFFRENVPGNADGQLGYFIPALERLGCRIAVGIFSAGEVGAGHRRERLFIMADRESGGGGLFLQQGRQDQAGDEPARRGEAMADADGRNASAERQQCGREQRFHTPNDGTGAGMADTGGARSQGHQLARTYIDERHGPDAHGSAAQLRSLCLPAFAPGPSDPRWPDIIARTPQLEPAVRRMADGLAHRVDRLRACGNGVVPLAAAYAWRTLSAHLAEDTRAGVTFLSIDAA